MNYILDSIFNTEVTVLSGAIKLLLSFVLGASIGQERRSKGQIAGLRTFALISMGATLAMLVSIYIPQEYMGLKNGDPGRIAAQVISGIGFLGAGAIIQSKGNVRGLTTAAGIWMTAAIGLAVGAGMYLIAIIATALIIFVMVKMEKYEYSFLKSGESKIIRIKTDGIVEDITPYKKDFDKYGIHIQDEFVKYEYRQNISIINFITLCKERTNYHQLFREMRCFKEIRSITLTNEVSN